jgi:D-3-phosphoglycerate dehydrogenase
MVARYGRAFQMRVRYYDPYRTVSLDGLERMDRLEDLIEQSDIVSIHVPHEKETEGMIGQSILQKFRPGSYLVNTSRGELLDWSALLEALRSGRLAGAALDVFEGEFAPGFESRFPAHPVLEYVRTHDNLLLTPHIGGSTIDAWRLTEQHTIDMALEALRAERSHG